MQIDESLGNLHRETISHIALHDFPSSWEELLYNIVNTLKLGYSNQP